MPLSASLCLSLPRLLTPIHSCLVLLCDAGSLKDYLIKQKGKGGLPLTRLVAMARDVALGMEFVAAQGMLIACNTNTDCMQC